MRNRFSLDVMLWLLLAALWSSSYTVIKVAVVQMDPACLVVGRMLVGSIAIYALLKFKRMSLSRRLSDWVAYVVTGLLGSALPFLLISYGEQTVDSALTAILMGVVPVATLLLAAAAVSDEHMTMRRSIGVIGGFMGVVTLIGPTALAGLGAELSGQLAIVGATLCYAASTVYIRRFVQRPALEMAAGSMISGTILMTGFALWSGADLMAITPTAASLGAIIYLGLFCTAGANFIYFFLVPRLGATRTAQVNFAVPVGGALLGVLLLGEALTWERMFALFVIIGSVYVGTTGGQPAKRSVAA